MSNRYKTPAEIAGAKRRTKAYQDKLRKTGMKARQHWVNDAENAQIKQVVKRWRGEPTDLSAIEAEAADELRPKEDNEREGRR